MKKSHLLPTGFMEVDEAAERLNVSRIRLYEIIRDELLWLYSQPKKDGKPKGAMHNQPKRLARKMGYVTTQERGHGMRGGYENIRHAYEVVLIGDAGYHALREWLLESGKKPKIIENRIAPPIARPTPPPSECKKTQSSEQARSEAMKQLKEWDLAG